MFDRTGVIVATLLALAASALLTWPVWPGFMSPDSLFAYRESLEGITTSAFPPLQAYFFSAFRALGLGVGGVLFFQAFVLFFGSALILRSFIRPMRWFVGAFVAYVFLFLYFPTMVGTVFVQWKDVPTAGFFVMGIALWLIAIERRSYPFLFAGILSIGVALAARLNAVTMAAVPLALIVAFPLGGRSTARARMAAAACVLVAFIGAYASLLWRLPDFKGLPSAGGVFQSIMYFDLVGVSACEDIDFLPPELGHAMSGDEIRQHFDPRSFDLALQPRPGIPNIESLDDVNERAAVTKVWERVIPSHFGCYVAQRAAVFEELVGLDAAGVWYPTNGTIDPNPYGFQFAHPAAGAAAAEFVFQGADMLWRRAFILYIIAPIVALGAWLLLGRRFLLLPVLTLGALSYLGALALIAPAADARYIFPSNVVCALVIVLGIEALLELYVERRTQGRSESDPKY